LQIEDESKIRSTNRKRVDEALAELVTAIFWVAPEDERTMRNFALDSSLELVRESYFDEIVMTAYRYKLIWQRAAVRL
jgi:hypothetical protein